MVVNWARNSDIPFTIEPIQIQVIPLWQFYYRKLHKKIADGETIVFIIVVGYLPKNYRSCVSRIDNTYVTWIFLAKVFTYMYFPVYIWFHFISRSRQYGGLRPLIAVLSCSGSVFVLLRHRFSHTCYWFWERPRADETKRYKKNIVNTTRTAYLMNVKWWEYINMSSSWIIST